MAGPLGASEGRAIRAVKPHVIQGTGHVVQGIRGRQTRADRPRLKDSGLTDRGGPLNRGTAQRPYQLCAIDPLGAHCWGFADYFSAPYSWGLVVRPFGCALFGVLRVTSELRIARCFAGHPLSSHCSGLTDRPLGFHRESPGDRP